MNQKSYDRDQDDLIKSLKTNTRKMVSAHHEAVENQNNETEFLLSLDKKSLKKNAEESDVHSQIDNKIVNKNVDKDVGRIIISVFINLLIKVTPYINTFKYIHYASYALITINILYLLLKLKKINTFEQNKKKNGDLIIPININNAILRTEINNSNTNTQSTKSFFKNIETTPLSKRTSLTSGTAIGTDNTNNIDSSYTLSSKFTYKINKV